MNNLIKKISIATLLAAVGPMAQAQVCIPAGFGGTTAPFNAFMFEYLHGAHLIKLIFLIQGQLGDVEGRVAVGGNAKLDDFLIGHIVPGNGNCDTHGLVVRGKIDMYQGKINGMIDCKSDGSTWNRNAPNCPWLRSYQPWIDFDATRGALSGLSGQLGGLQTTGTFADNGLLTLKVIVLFRALN
jgi:hypothetical protein